MWFPDLLVANKASDLFYGVLCWWSLAYPRIGWSKSDNKMRFLHPLYNSANIKSIRINIIIFINKSGNRDVELVRQGALLGCWFPYESGCLSSRCVVRIRRLCLFVHGNGVDQQRAIEWGWEGVNLPQWKILLKRHPLLNEVRSIKSRTHYRSASRAQLLLGSIGSLD